MQGGDDVALAGSEPWEKMSCCLMMGLAFQLVPAPSASPAGLGCPLNSDFTLRGEISEPERERICQSLRLARCHQGHYII